jgi:hypothetical protein
VQYASEHEQPRRLHLVGGLLIVVYFAPAGDWPWWQWDHTIFADPRWQGVPLTIARRSVCILQHLERWVEPLPNPVADGLSGAFLLIQIRLACALSRLAVGTSRL